jgi:uncharacterized protein YkwD
MPDNSFPQTLVYRRARFVLPLSCLLLISGLVANAQAQSSQSRPVARLIASANHAIASDTITRPRTTATFAPARANAHAVAPAPMVATSDERRIFDLVNQARRAQGYAPLMWDAEAARIAREHSADMARNGYLAHESSDGRTLVMRAHAQGLAGWSAVAENIAYNQGFDDPDAFAVERWLKSEKHRENIMRAGFTHTGLGIARSSDGRIYFTQVFVAR